MLKRILILAFVLSALVLLALAPMNVPSTSANTHKLQATEQPTEPPVVGVTIVVGETSTVPVTGGGGLPASTLIIFGLVAVLGVAVVIGGMALISRRQ